MMNRLRALPQWALSFLAAFGIISSEIIKGRSAKESHLNRVKFEDLHTFELDEELFYSAKVDSVFCESGVCSIVPVILVWDALGRFDHIEIPSGMQLEKDEGKPFDESDYRKLNEVLKDSHSQLSNLDYLMVDEHGNALDRSVIITQATPPVQKGSYVEGALWTCYTLWKHAHGSISKEIYDFTTWNLNKETLLQFLLSEDIDFVSYALKHLKKQNLFQPSILSKVIARGHEITEEPRITKNLLDYLLSAPERLAGNSIIKLYEGLNESQRNVVLNHLLTQDKLSFPIAEALEPFLKEPKSFQELETYLELCQHEQFVPLSLQALLKQDDFLISRRVFWFFHEQSALEVNQELLHQYQIKHHNKL